MQAYTRAARLVGWEDVYVAHCVLSSRIGGMFEATKGSEIIGAFRSKSYEAIDLTYFGKESWRPTPVVAAGFRGGTPMAL